MRIRKVIQINGMEYIDLLRELRNCGYSNKRTKEKTKADFKLEFLNNHAHSDAIVLTVYNSDMFRDVRVKRLLLEYLI